MTSESVSSASGFPYLSRTMTRDLGDASVQIRMVECLCPKKHFLTGLAYAGPHDPVSIDKLKVEMKKAGITEWCAACGTVTATYEDHPTLFQTMQEAIEYQKARIEGLNVETQFTKDVKNFRKIREN